MKLRQRLSLVFAGATSLTVAAALFLTVTAFKHAQERALDQSLLLRASLEAKDVVRLGGRLSIEQQASTTPAGASADVDYLVKYGALYRADGTLMQSTPTFGTVPPSLSRLGWHAGNPLPSGGIDFPSQGRVLRGVLVRAGGEEDESGPVLLLAAARGDLDSDTQNLFKLMGLVMLLSVAISLLIGRWIGGRMTRGIERIAQVARRVSEGELDARVASLGTGKDDEIRTLANDLNQMIDRLSGLIEAGSRFVSHAAHELRSPLAALRGELELALRHPRSTEGYQTAIKESLEDTNRLISLAEDLLVLARLNVSERGEPDARTSLQAVVREAVRASIGRGDARGQARQVEVRVEDAEVCGRTADLSRMVRNLLDNALAHAPEGTPVRVIGGPMKGEPGQVLLAVEDQGPGVPKELRDRIFEPFFRGAEEREHSGAGLGLAIAREIARAQGGDLLLDQGAPTTRFVATLRSS